MPGALGAEHSHLPPVRSALEPCGTRAFHIDLAFFVRPLPEDRFGHGLKLSWPAESHKRNPPVDK